MTTGMNSPLWTDGMSHNHVSPPLETESDTLSNYTRAKDCAAVRSLCTSITSVSPSIFPVKVGRKQERPPGGYQGETHLIQLPTHPPENEQRGGVAQHNGSWPSGFFSFVLLITTVPHSAKSPQGHLLSTYPQGSVTGFSGSVQLTA